MRPKKIDFRGLTMPLVSDFFGIKIYMYWDEHNPPHFHAHFNEYKVMISINEAVAIKGEMPHKQLKLVVAWCEIHKEELISNWNSAMKNDSITKISPLR